MQLPAPPANVRRIVFFGSPTAAISPLRSLVESGYEVALVVSRPDARRRRRSEPEPSPLKAAALELGLLTTDAIEDAHDVGADLGVVVAYGAMLREPTLTRLPLVNLHFSLLPRWRGAAPVERAILAGDEQTGVCVMQIEEGLDTGAVYGRVVTDIDPDETATELTARLSTLGATLLTDVLDGGLGTPEPQTGEPEYAHRIEVDDLRIDWGSESKHVGRLVRLERAWTTWRGEKMRIHSIRLAEDAVDPDLDPGRAALSEPGIIPGTLAGVHVRSGDGTIELIEVQAAGRRRQPAAEWANGARPEPGELLGI